MVIKRTMVDKEILADVEKTADDAELEVVDRDLERPWGGFLVLDEAQIKEFADAFFPELELPESEARMSPKFLIVAPKQRLSWQYHHRRSEHWRVVRGPVGVAVSETDEPSEPRILREGEEIEIARGERHRLVGLEDWGVVAEIWMHADPDEPSDESDIVRVQDDYRRK